MKSVAVKLFHIVVVVIITITTITIICKAISLFWGKIVENVCSLFSPCIYIYEL